MALRRKIFGAYFIDPKEGANKVALANGWSLTGTYKIARKVDPGLLQAAAENLREHGINVDMVINWKPELVTSVYRKLTAEQIHLIDQCLEIKEGSPELKLIGPKE